MHRHTNRRFTWLHYQWIRLNLIDTNASCAGPSPCSCLTSRCFSIQPENTVYSGPSAPSPKRVTLRTLQTKYRKGEPISMVTAYDYPSAVHVRTARETNAANAVLCPAAWPHVRQASNTALPVPACKAQGSHVAHYTIRMLCRAWGS